MIADERCLCWPTDEKYHFNHYGAVEPGSAWEHNPHCPKHGKFPRFKIACCNWTTPGFVHFVAYLAIDGGARFEKYTHTYAEAWAHIERIARRVTEWLAAQNGEQR